MKITLELTREQVDALLNALDLHGRIHMGQLVEIRYIRSNRPMSNGQWPDLDKMYSWEVNEAFALLRKVLYGLDSGSLGCTESALAVEAKRSYDLLQVIRHAVSWKEHPEGGVKVCFDTPMKTAPDPLPKIRLED